jgi:DNA repair photolyase
LAKGNEILIVSKPHLECIQAICEKLADYKDRIVFRFTIGSMYDEYLGFWEPGAPDYEERKASLKFAYEAGFTTSVSCEPYLDPQIDMLVDELLPFINDVIWIGKMNKKESRIDFDEWTEDDYKYLDVVDNCQTDSFVQMLYERFKDEPKVKWKDSIKQVMGLEEEATG